MLKKLNYELTITGIFKIKSSTVSENYYSRRELFSMFRNSTVHSFKDLTQEISEDLLFGNNRGIPEPRKLLANELKVISKKEVSSKSPPFFTKLDVNSKCTSCGLCLKACANNALVKEKHKDQNDNLKNIYLKHKLWLCIDCGVCRQVCPTGTLNKLKFTGSLRDVFTPYTVTELSK